MRRRATKRPAIWRAAATGGSAVLPEIRSTRVTQERLLGYRRALEEAGIPWEEKLVAGGDYTLESGSQALSYLLGQHVTAIFAIESCKMAFLAFIAVHAVTESASPRISRSSAATMYRLMTCWKFR